ncbi:YcgL domain-containing protein [Pasteurella multocida]|uniref:YcgL domain-containing protein n=1 Tax=Pasteurella multocida TaxID=747 RepID=UPI00061A7F12|nr:YcgL domain-containing protein [Pasteurella multocida]AKD41267.1 protein YcgL [Pasteurella multocida OH1905]
MLCAIYKSTRKMGTYLYVAKRDQFDAVPEVLRNAFGPPIFVMMFNLAGEKALINAEKAEVRKQIETQGFYLQMPKEDDWLFKL